MGGAKSKNKTAAISEEFYQLAVQCIKTLGWDINDTRLISATRIIEITGPSALIEKGSPASGVYIVVEGEVHVVATDGTTVLSVITKGDFFGEVSSLFSVPATVDVLVPGRAVLLHISQDVCATQTVSSSLTDWFILRRYFCTSDVIHRPEYKRKFLLDVLSNVSLFEFWNEESLLTLGHGLSSNPMILYPTNSLIVGLGDHTNHLTILVKGRADVFDETGEIITTFQARKFPFCIGEEGIFTDSRSSIRVQATVPCLVISIRKENIMDTIQIQPDTQMVNLHAQRQEQWTRRKSQLLPKYTALLQTEVIYTFLRKSSIFENCSPLCVYSTAMYGFPVASELGTTLNKLSTKGEDFAILVLLGHLVLREDDGSILQKYDTHEVFYPEDWISKYAKLSGETDCFIVKFSTSDIINSVKNYPPSALNFT